MNGAKFISLDYRDVAFAILEDNSVIGWGGNGHRSLWGAIPVGLKATFIGATVVPDLEVAYAIREDGTVIYWGYGIEQTIVPNRKAKWVYMSKQGTIYISEDDTISLSSVAGGPLFQRVPVGVKVKSICIKASRGLAIKEDGTTVGFGTTNSPTPPYSNKINFTSPVPPDVKLKSAALVGYITVYGIREDGTVQVWTNPGDEKYFPVPPGLKAKQIIAEPYGKYVVKEDGTSVAWTGKDDNLKPIPHRLPNGLKVKSIAGDDVTILAIREDGSIAGWGIGPVIERIPKLNVPKEIELYKGYSESDIRMFETMFENPKDWSICPICLSFTERKDGCMFMKHICPINLRNEELYRHFKPQVGAIDYIEWCTLCGRPCQNHRHLMNPEVSETEPIRVAPLTPDVEADRLRFYNKDCQTQGGGGLAEKIYRLYFLVEAACEFQDHIGEDAEKVRNDIIVGCFPIGDVAKRVSEDDRVKRAMDAAEVYRQQVLAGVENPTPVRLEIPEWCKFNKDDGPQAEKVYPDVVRPADEAGFAPIKHEDAECLIGAGATDGEVGNVVWELQHTVMPKTNPPTLNGFHNNKYICAEDLVSTLKAKQFTGKCPGDITENKCQVWLYPEEVKAIIGEAHEYYPIYKDLFNKKYAEASAVGGGEDIPSLLNRADDAVCSIPLPKKGAKRRTLKKGKGRRKQTRRKSFRRRR